VVNPDALTQLAAANPVPTDARDRIAKDLQLQDLRPRTDASERRSSGRRIILTATTVVVLAATVVLVAPALGLRFGWIDFFTAEHAPPAVVNDFATLSQGAPAGMDPGVIPGETRKVMTMRFSGRDHTLWVAPTAAGGLCFEWTQGMGGCDRNGEMPLSVSWGAPAVDNPPSTPKDFQMVEGHVHAPWVDGVEIHLSDGSTVEPDVTWISPPIDAGFFVYEAPRGLTIRSVVGTRGGEAVDADDFGSGEDPSTEPVPSPFADLSKRHVVKSIETDAGRATVWSAPTKTDEVCTWLEVGNLRRNVMPCLPPDDIEGTAMSSAAVGNTCITWTVTSGGIDLHALASTDATPCSPASPARSTRR
jgi:hypothetical protein